jgi:putative flippase GtrA
VKRLTALAVRAPIAGQFGKFALVGLSGYLVNLAVFGAVRAGGVATLAAATVSFCVAVANNYVWNRLWTFRRDRGDLLGQGVRFLVVSLLSLGCNLLVLRALVQAGVGALPGQAIGIAASLPVNFAGNKLWTFRERRRTRKSGGVRARRLALTTAVSLAALGALAGAGWAVQDTVLNPPTGAAQLAGNMSTRIGSRALAIDAFHVDGRTVRGACLSGWFDGKNDRKRPGMLLTLSTGQRILASNPDKASFGPQSRRRALAAKLALRVGCTSSLANELGQAAQTDRVKLHRRRFAGMTVLALVIPRYRGERLTLLVTRHRHLPVGAVAVIGGEKASARFYLPQPSQSLLVRLGLQLPAGLR